MTIDSVDRVLAGRGPVCAASFFAVLVGTRVPAARVLAGRGPVSTANFPAVLAGTRVTPARTRTKAANP
ncbi:hypothetical protein Amsp01_018280 [Amycolatopsis sp. NBRC 101858]|nr:hypothetical protein Amsp01_018280 [Amycolatopsis sp. NBRC 101858]